MTRTLTAHGRAIILCAWLAAYSYALPAAAENITVVSTMSAGLRDYEYTFVGWGVLLAVVGGFGRTVLTLLSPDVVILSVLRETWRDLLVAALAGVIASMLMLAVRALGVDIPTPVAVLVLGACGWAGMGFFLWAEKSVRTVADRGAQWAADKIAKTDPYANLPPRGGYTGRRPPSNPDDREPEL